MSPDRDATQLFNELDRIELPSAAVWLPADRRSRRSFLATLQSIASAGALGFVVLVVIALVIISRPSAPTGVVSSPSPSVSPAPTTAAASPSPVVASPTPAGSLLGGSAMGRPTGEYAFVALETSQPGTGQVRAELWALPLDGSEPRRVLVWLRPAGGIRPPGPTVVSRQLSPDGRSFAFAGTDGVQVVDLVTGALRTLASQGDSPIWSPDGARIAYTKWTSESSSTAFAVQPDGSGLEQMPGAGPALAWSPDGGRLAIGDGIYQALPARSAGGPVARWPDLLNGGDSPLSWRRASPQIALVASASPNGVEQRLELLDVGGTARVLIRESGSLTETVFGEPRWHPTESQVLYLRSGAAGAEIRIVDVSAGSPQSVRVSGTPKRAEWNPAGTRVIYITSNGGHDEVRFTPRLDGSATNEGTLFSAANSPGERLVSLGCVVLR